MKYLQLFENFETFDLQKEFDYLNNLMFDNRVKPVPLKWFKSKSKLGLLTHLDREVLKLEISTFYNATKKQLMETLAHEMIHAYMVQNGIFEKNDHGPKFMRILNDLNARFPEYNIKKTEDAAEFTVNAKHAKNIGVLLFKQDEKYLAVFISGELANNEDALNSFVESVKNYIGRNPLNIFYKYKNVEMMVYRCNHPDLSSFTIKRLLSLKSLAFYNIDDITLSKILEGELTKSYILK